MGCSTYFGEAALLLFYITGKQMNRFLSPRFVKANIEPCKHAPYRKRKAGVVVVICRIDKLAVGINGERLNESFCDLHRLKISALVAFLRENTHLLVDRDRFS